LFDEGSGGGGGDGELEKYQGLKYKFLIV